MAGDLRSAFCPERRGSEIDDLRRLWLPKRENLYQVDSMTTPGTGKLDLRGV